MDTHVTGSSAEFSLLAERVVSSGLVSDDDWTSLSIAARGEPAELEKLLTEKGILTAFQVAALKEGRGGSLRIGNYDILDRLGAGGMGTVFKARHRRMKRVVALKVLAEHLSKSPIFVKRFQREVETIACLGHPNIVMAYDADEADVGHFLVMEFVSGLDLAAYVGRAGPLPVGHAVDCVLQAARGLAYAHSQGIIHRDIKPHNLLHDNSGAIKITDLGLARLDQSITRTDVSMAGSVIGTPEYMSPEQAIDSTAIDNRVDIYSLGCTLHFLLTGKPPFSGPSAISILLNHRDAEIPTLRTVRPEVPARLDDLFRRMLAKQPDDRIQRMSDVVSELESIASELSPAERDCGPVATTLELSSGIGPSPTQASSTEQLTERTAMMTKIAPAISVLIVEPSRVQASIIKGYLLEHSMAVAGIVANGSEAIQAVRDLRPRAVVSAMYLSDIDGVQLAQQIRSEITADAPGFVLVTSEGGDGESASLSKLHRVLTLQKPFTSQQLGEAVGYVVGASRPVSVVRPWATPAGKITRDQVRVLIADDSSTARVNIRTVLQGLGISKFLEVSDGANAIVAAAREVCQLIVTDYNMPLMDGRALVSYLKQNPATAAIPIIMVTTVTDPKLLEPVRQLGVVAIVEKAFPASVVGPLLDSLF